MTAGKRAPDWTGASIHYEKEYERVFSLHSGIYSHLVRLEDIILYGRLLLLLGLNL